MVQHREEMRHQQWLTGVIASAVANWSMGRNPESEPMQPKDFPLPLLQGKKNREPRLNRKKIAEDIRSQFDMAKQRMAAMPQPQMPRSV